MNKKERNTLHTFHCERVLSVRRRECKTMFRGVAYLQTENVSILGKATTASHEATNE